jgi:hypothetical protein
VALSTTTIVVPSGSPSNFGQALTLTATVNSSSGTPTGSVDFYDTTTAIDLGSVTLVNGKAALATATLPAGSNTITVTYGASGSYLGSNGSTTVSILTSFYLMNTTATGALTLSGNANIKIAGLVDVDSNSSSAISASGNAQITAGAIQVVGKVQSVRCRDRGWAWLHGRGRCGGAGVTKSFSIAKLDGGAGGRCSLTHVG